MKKYSASAFDLLVFCFLKPVAMSKKAIYLAMMLFFILIEVSQAGIVSSQGIFIKNQGQWSDEALYSFQSAGYSAWITRNSIILDAHKIINKENRIYKEGHVIKLKFNTAESQPNVINHSYQIKTYYNFFKGKDKTKWVKRAPGYSELRLNSFIDGGDLRLYTDKNNLRFDIISKPEENIKDFTFSIEGADNYFINQSGELIIETSLGSEVISDLSAYQIVGGCRKSVGCEFSINSNGNIIFEAKNYDRALLLVIDPLIYSTILGDSNNEYSSGIKLDAEGNAYIAGYTASDDFPASTGAYSEDLSNKEGMFDIFVSKIKSSGDSLIYSTYIGSKANDFCQALAIDNESNIYVTGYTGESHSFPVTDNALDTSYNGGFDVFVSKLSSDGTELIYSTLLGGTKDDYAMAIALDSQNNAYITGYFKDGGFPVSDNSYQSEASGEYDVFLTKLNSDGSGIIYSTYLGGEKDDFGQGIAVDNDGIAYITGITISDSFPTTANALDNSLNDNGSDSRNDVFISKISADGSELLYSTYLGGSAKDGAYDIKVDAAQNIYVTGFTESTDFPVTPDAYDTKYSSVSASTGAGDIFITKLKNSGDSLLFSTYIGGESAERAYSIDLDARNNIFITGTTSSRDFPTTNLAHDKSYNDTAYYSDAFLVKLNAAGNKVLYSTYLGGSASDVGKGVKEYSDGTVYLTGTSFSTDFPVNFILGNIAPDSAYSNAFLVKIDPIIFEVDAGPDKDICRGSGAQIGKEVFGGYGNKTFSWSPATGLSNPSILQPYASPASSTTYTLTAHDEKDSIAIDEVVVKVHEPPEPVISGVDSVLLFASYKYSAGLEEGMSYQWIVYGGTITKGQGTNEVIIKWTSPGLGIVYLIVRDKYNCTGMAQGFTVAVSNKFVIKIEALALLISCKGTPVILDAGAGFAQYLWSDNKTTRFDSIEVSGDYWVYVEDYNAVIGTSDTVSVEILPAPEKPIISYNEQDNVLRCMNCSRDCQWYLNNEKIENEFARSYRPKADGWYKIEVYWDTNDCTRFSDSLYIVIDDVVDIQSEYKLYVYPCTGQLAIEADFERDNNIKLELYDVIGRAVLSFSDFSYSGKYYKTINTGNLTPGIYLLRFDSDEFHIFKQIIFLCY